MLKTLKHFSMVGLPCVAFYAWVTDAAILSESIAAVVVALVVVAFAVRLDRDDRDRARIGLDWVVPFATRVIPAIFSESFELIGPVLFRRIVLRRATAGRWIALRYDPRDRSPNDEAGRRAFVVFASNLTPNALPLDIDPDAGTMVLHQIVARREAAASDPRYPM